ncbi:Uncharacterised protein [Vibrio cholerae]|nr:Uncharacterised protein [Vibrio cholerae]
MRTSKREMLLSLLPLVLRSCHKSHLLRLPAYEMGRKWARLK